MSTGAFGLERLRNRRVAIWGPGAEGLEVARAALDRGADVVFLTDRERASAPRQPETIAVGDAAIPVRSPSVLGETHFDCLVRSPGVSVYRSEIASARGAGSSVTSATAMWFEDFSGSRIVAVTGTKGKTTTAWLTSLLLEACGLSVALGGNMGTPLTLLYDRQGCDVYVVEISSFQAADVQVSPPVGVLTLIAPDHLDWHFTYENYVRDKLNLFTHRPDVDLAVNATDPEVLSRTRDFPRRHEYGATGRVVVDGDHLSVDGEAMDVAALPLRGRHNLVNLCGAVTACLLTGAPLPAHPSLEQALAKMPALPSRLETVGRCCGIEFVNDALASNPAGAVAALRTFAGRRVCLIAGGQDRGVALDALVSEISSMRPPPILVSLPGVGTRLSEELHRCTSELLSKDAQTVQEAVKIASSLIRGSEPDGEAVVLFSPAAPTPFSEGSYVQRGALFNQAVSDLCRSRS